MNDLLCETLKCRETPAPHCHARETATPPPPPRPHIDKFVVRLPDGMRQLIAVQARDNERSMNSEIIHRLRKIAELEEALDRAHKMIDQLLAQGPTDEQSGART